MPFDPNLPQENTLADAAQMRAQLNALNDKIDTTLPGPQGEKGDPGEPGPAGSDGAPGIQGPQGEVSRADLDDAIAGTARNPTGLATLDAPYADPASEELRVAHNALLTLLFRAPV